MLGSPTITMKGRNLLAKIVADKIPLTLSYIGLGDGLQEETEEVISLVNEIMKKEIESCEYNEKEGQYYIRRVFTNAELEEGFYIREVGIYAIDPDEGEILYAYTNAGETGVDYFAPGKGKVIVKEIIEMATKFGNAENITVMIDPSIALVTEQEFEDYKNSNKIDINNLQAQIDEHKEEYTQLKEDVEQLSNFNILNNAYFKNPVNQRDKTKYECISDSGVIYTIDRWQVPNKWDMIVELTSNGLKLTSKTDSRPSTSPHSTFRQFFEYELDDTKVYTLSAKIDGEIHEASGILYDSNGSAGTCVIRYDNINLYATKNKVELNIISSADESHVVEWIKLEYGNKATPFYPRSYGKELALCRRYCKYIDGLTLGNSSGSNTNTQFFDISQFTYDMRVIPTLTYKQLYLSDNSAYSPSGIVKRDSSTYTVNGIVQHRIRIDKKTDTANFPEKMIAQIEGLLLDSEIY